MLKEENTFSSGNLRVLWVQGTGITSMAHLTKIKQAIDKLDMLVVVEPFVNEVAILSERKMEFISCQLVLSLKVAVM